MVVQVIKKVLFLSQDFDAFELPADVAKAENHLVKKLDIITLRWLQELQDLL